MTEIAQNIGILDPLPLEQGILHVLVAWRNGEDFGVGREVVSGQEEGDVHLLVDEFQLIIFGYHLGKFGLRNQRIGDRLVLFGSFGRLCSVLVFLSVLLLQGIGWGEKFLVDFRERNISIGRIRFLNEFACSNSLYYCQTHDYRKFKLLYLLISL